MSRVLITALAFSVFGGQNVLAQPLNINPFPQQKAATISGQGPAVVKKDDLEKFAREADQEVLRLVREKEALAKKLKDNEAARASEEQSRLEVIEREKAAAVASAKQLELEKAALAKRLRDNEAARALEEQSRLEMVEREKAAAVASAKQLELEKAALAAKLLEVDGQRKAEKQQRDALVDEQRAKTLADQARIDAMSVIAEEEVYSLKQKNQELAEELRLVQEKQQQEAALAAENQRLQDELRAVEEKKNREAELAREQKLLAQQLKELEVQQAADEAARVAALQVREEVSKPVQVAEPEVLEVRMSAKDQFEDGALLKPLVVDSSNRNDQSGVHMTPMPLRDADKIDFSKAEPVDALKVASARPDVALGETPQEIRPAGLQRDSKVDLNKVRLEVLPSGQGAGASRAVFTKQQPFLTARPGESLEDVLRSWSRSEGVGFLWKTTQAFAIPKPVSADGGYEAAVTAVLDQYAGKAGRPVGKLHSDPVTGVRTLSVFSE